MQQHCAVYVHQDLPTFTSMRCRWGANTQKQRRILHGTAGIGRTYHSLTPLALLRLSLYFVRHLLSQMVSRGCNQ